MGQQSHRLFGIFSTIVALLLSTYGLSSFENDRARRKDAEVRRLQRFALENLRQEMPMSDVRELLRRKGFEPFRLSRNSLSVSEFYAAHEMFDPVLLVRFRRERRWENEPRLTRWEIQR